MFRVIVAGGRDFDNAQWMDRCLTKFLANYMHSPSTTLEIVCGGARGADSLGRDWAEGRGIPVALFGADWGTHGKRAGILRNIEMGDYANAAVIFWDGQSKGSKHMLEYMQSLGKPVRVVRYKKKGGGI